MQSRICTHLVGPILAVPMTVVGCTSRTETDRFTSMALAIQRIIFGIAATPT